MKTLKQVFNSLQHALHQRVAESESRSCELVQNGGIDRSVVIIGVSSSAR